MCYICQSMIGKFKKSDKALVEFVTYTFVAGLAFLIDFGALKFFTEFFKIYYLYSGIIAFVLGLTTNYLLSVNWVFRVRRIKNVRMEFAIFAIIGLVGLGFNEAILWFFTEERGIYYLHSKLIATGVVFVWNFVARKVALF